jgi:chromosome segregation ATPase
VWKKIWVWIKKYSHLIIAGVGTAAGFILGVSLGRRHPDFEQLRADNRELVRQVERLREGLKQLQANNAKNEHELVHLREQLTRAEEFVGQSDEYFNGTRSDIDGLQQTNQQLRDWLLKYGKELEAIQGDR